MEKKVYVLSINWTIDCESDSKYTQVFDTREKAQKALKEDFDETLSDYADWEKELNENSASIWESGDYSRNHCDWQIDECEIN